MGDSLVYDKKDEKENSPLTGKNAASETTAEIQKESSEIPVAAAITPATE